MKITGYFHVCPEKTNKAHESSAMDLTGNSGVCRPNHLTVNSHELSARSVVESMSVSGLTGHSVRSLGIGSKWISCLIDEN